MTQSQTDVQRQGALLSYTDLTVIAAGVAVAASTTEQWAALTFWVPEAFKFISLTATTIFLVFRAGNEIRKYFGSSRNRPGDST